MTQQVNSYSNNEKNTLYLRDALNSRCRRKRKSQLRRCTSAIPVLGRSFLATQQVLCYLGLHEALSIKTTTKRKERKRKKTERRERPREGREGDRQGKKS